jgi:hypothetical protein
MWSNGNGFCCIILPETHYQWKNVCTQRSLCVSNRLVVVSRKFLTSHNGKQLPKFLGYTGRWKHYCRRQLNIPIISFDIKNRIKAYSRLHRRQNICIHIAKNRCKFYAFFIFIFIQASLGDNWVVNNSPRAGCFYQRRMTFDVHNNRNMH